jgi:hypothetical protein
VGAARKAIGRGDGKSPPPPFHNSKENPQKLVFLSHFTMQEDYQRRKNRRISLIIILLKWMNTMFEIFIFYTR